MTGLIVATSIIGAILVATIVVGAVKMYNMDKNMTTMAECLLECTAVLQSIDVVEDYEVGDYTNAKKCSNHYSGSDFDFPNNSGF